MSSRAMRLVGYTAMGMIFFVCTLVIIKWAIDFVTWSTLDDGWAQAIGSVIAICAAIYIMNEQHRTQEALAGRTSATHRGNLLLSASLVGSQVISVGTTLTQSIERSRCQSAALTFTLDRIEGVLRHADQIPVWKMEGADAREFYRIINATHQIMALLRLGISENIANNQGNLPTYADVGGIEQSFGQTMENISTCKRWLETEYERVTGHEIQI